MPISTTNGKSSEKQESKKQKNQQQQQHQTITYIAFKHHPNQAGYLLLTLAQLTEYEIFTTHDEHENLKFMTSMTFERHN